MVDAASNILDEKCILCHSCRENVFCQYRMTVRNLRVVYVRLTNGVVVIKMDANNCYNDIVSEINEMRKMTPLTKYVDKDDSLINIRVVYVRLTNGVVVIKKDANNCNK